MTVFTYARVSTLDQNTDLQERALKAAYPDAKHLQETGSGTTIKTRNELTTILKIVSPGDKLVVWKLDRLARNLHDLTGIVKNLHDKGAALEILDQNIDTSTATGKAFLHMLGVFAEFETNLRKERQLAGIAAAKAKGKHLGRKSILSDKQKQEIRDSRDRMNPTELSQEYGVSRATVYNILKSEC